VKNTDVGAGILFLCLCLGLSACRYTEHRMEIEKIKIEKGIK